MRGSLSPARLLTGALVALAVAAASVSTAFATTSTVSANGLAVTASLSPDVANSGQKVLQFAAVKNTSDVKENVVLRIISPRPSAFPASFTATLQPGATFSRAVTFGADLLGTGTHTLTVIGINRATGGSAQASASVSVNK